MATVGLVAHPDRPRAVELEQQTIRWLEARGHQARALPGTEAGVDTETCPAQDDVSDLDLVVSLGGDGTMLRSVRLAAPTGIPVLGVNLGHLGYLTVLEPEHLEHGLQRFLDGDYTIDRRVTLQVFCRPSDGGPVEDLHLALNDVVLQRPGGGHTVRVAVRVNGRPFVSFAADALIVATPTGSTAYNLSARGPIVSPRAQVHILTPVAPHSLFDRSLVLAADERIEVLTEDGRDADLVIDGIVVGRVGDGQVIEIAAGRDACLVAFEPREFPDIVSYKFDLGHS
jgi:NAD+ kinase